MATEWVEIADTAVKIGLGASISGITTYFLARYKFNEEAKRGKKKVYRDLMLEATKDADKYFDFLYRYFARLHGISVTFEDKKPLENDWEEIWNHIKEIESGLEEFRRYLYSAQSRFQLMGMKKPLKLLRELRSGEEELRGFYMRADRVLPSEDFFSLWSNKYVPLKDLFGEAISEEFKENC